MTDYHLNKAQQSPGDKYNTGHENRIIISLENSMTNENNKQNKPPLLSRLLRALAIFFAVLAVYYFAKAYLK